MIKLKKILFWIIPIIIAVVILFAIDLALHFHLSDQSGYNVQGFRGNAGPKNADHVIACFGGSTTYGFGVRKNETWPFLLEEQLSNSEQNVSVLNLGANAQGIYGINYDVDGYDYLNYDIALIYTGYNDLNPHEFNDYRFRGSDIFFRLFHYKPIIVVYLRERLNLAGKKFKDNGSKIIFELDDDTLQHERTRNQFSRELIRADSIARLPNATTIQPYQEYLHYLLLTFNKLLEVDKKIYFILPPKLENSFLRLKSEEVILNYDNINFIMMDEFIDMDDKTLCFDGIHLTPKGNNIIAAQLALILKNQF